ncbi:MAG TPA: CU044_5270 family protein, partial [Thermomonospora sp.]|nr:CU044_5270 family protein [Thermomonospora sp.]
VLRLGAVVAVTATAVAGVAVVQNARDSDRGSTGPLVTVSTPAAKSDRPRPDQWSYLKGIAVGSSGGVGGMLFGEPDQRRTYERWVSADGTRTATRDKNGRLRIDPVSSMPGMSPPSGYPYILKLPTSADALLAHLDRVLDKEGGRGESTEARASRMFQIMEIWMREVAIPADLRAAMYEALGRIPGVRFENRAADVAGRPGVTFHRFEEGYLRTEIMIDPRTQAYMGYRVVAVRDHVSRGTDGERRIAKGHILGWGAVVRTAIVDRPGERP